MSQNPLFHYPAGYSDEDSDKDSLIDLNEENWDEDHSTEGQKIQTQPEEETTLKDTSAEQVEESLSSILQDRRQNRQHLPGFR